MSPLASLEAARPPGANGQPYRLASLAGHPASTVVEVGGAAIGGRRIVVIAGPCAVERREQVLETARAVKAAHRAMLSARSRVTVGWPRVVIQAAFRP